MTKTGIFAFSLLLLWGTSTESRRTTTTTTTTTSSTTQEGYGPEIAALAATGECASVEPLETHCYDIGTGDASAMDAYYEEYVTSEYRYIIISGVPNHDAEDDPLINTPLSRCERWQYVQLPLTYNNETDARADIYKSMGSAALVMSGAVTYDHRSSDTGDLAIPNEGDYVDSGNGHASPNRQYHYHAVPARYSSASDAASCEHIGYHRDGAPLYGLCQVDGVELLSCYATTVADPMHEDDYYFDYAAYANGDCHLDEANMYNFGGDIGYGYVISRDHPYVPIGIRGNPQPLCGFTPDYRL